MASKVRQVEREQLRGRINRIARMPWPAVPTGGWIRAVRQALGMPGTALSHRLSGTRAMAANRERYEVEGRLTLKAMKQTAEAMGCRFVYAIVPPEGKTIDELVREQAARRAGQLVARTDTQMSLENQRVGIREQSVQEARLAESLERELPRDLWADAPTDD